MLCSKPLSPPPLLAPQFTVMFNLVAEEMAERHNAFQQVLYEIWVKAADRVSYKLQCSQSGKHLPCPRLECTTVHKIVCDKAAPGGHAEGYGTSQGCLGMGLGIVPSGRQLEV